MTHLKNIYYATFSSNLFYGLQVWGQTSQSITDKILLLQKTAVRIVSFCDFRAHSGPLFKHLKLLKVHDNIFLQNCLFVHDFFHGNLPKSFENTFTKAGSVHSFLTRNASDGSLTIHRFNSTTYGLKSMYKQCINNWNTLTNIQKDIDLAKLAKDKTHSSINLHDISRSKLKQLITDYFINSYN